LDFRGIFCKNFYVTTSGFFSNPALLCTMMELGVDRILFAVDWPFFANAPGVQWLETIPLSDEDKIKIINGNATKLLNL
jgi:2,3-dihydroxybenzoate decarboxylase